MPDLNKGRKIAFHKHMEGREIIADDLPSYLIALENPNINKLNASREYCKQFTKVFCPGPQAVRPAQYRTGVDTPPYAP